MITASITVALSLVGYGILVGGFFLAVWVLLSYLD
jgi:hypothetical protein